MLEHPLQSKRQIVASCISYHTYTQAYTERKKKRIASDRPLFVLEATHSTSDNIATALVPGDLEGSQL